ncbi:isopenicillin N synthase family oxygenase [Litorivicinus lipolyticus]|uniref:2-oxoglutarate-dependent ethylene/succinate-forming enzyme n=1 Tax=Litorivicinus lipolyticus TaxID=418701 RepID=A0A5Q2QGL7_9GAMM|nr:2OG-Fe(II) oxygenase family protein [Litorivicinus lipolyticus]QGG80155.1 isopenicillin N synthase family oxygenase [Litorivicinus lipolyticus]
MKIGLVDCQAADAAAQFSRSLTDTGFAVLVNHGVDASCIDAVYQSWAKFFAQPDAVKREFVQDGQRGFFPYRSENAKGQAQKDLKEFFQVYPDARVPDEQLQITQDTYDALAGLGQRLLGWLQQQAPTSVSEQFSVPLTAMAAQSPKTMFRILHYPPVDAQQARAGAIRAAAHEDINLITLLLAGSAPGLQAMDRDGQWHDVSCDAGMIAVNAGDMLQMASGGYYPSTTHRVVNPQGAEAGVARYSMPMFIHPHADAVLKPGTTADQYLNERLREIGLAG